MPAQSTDGGIVTTAMATADGAAMVTSEAHDSLQSEALRALCLGWLGMLTIYAGTIFGPLWFSHIDPGAYDIMTKALAIEEKLMIALTSSLMTAVTMARK